MSHEGFETDALVADINKDVLAAVEGTEGQRAVRQLMLHCQSHLLQHLVDCRLLGYYPHCSGFPDHLQQWLNFKIVVDCTVEGLVPILSLLPMLVLFQMPLIVQQKHTVTLVLQCQRNLLFSPCIVACLVTTPTARGSGSHARMAQPRDCGRGTCPDCRMIVVVMLVQMAFFGGQKHTVPLMLHRQRDVLKYFIECDQPQYQTHCIWLLDHLQKWLNLAIVVEATALIS